MVDKYISVTASETNFNHFQVPLLKEFSREPLKGEITLQQWPILSRICTWIGACTKVARVLCQLRILQRYDLIFIEVPTDISHSSRACGIFNEVNE